MLYNEFNAELIPVIQLHQIVDGKCSCKFTACKAAGKHPKEHLWTQTPVRTSEEMLALEDSGAFDGGFGVLLSDGLMVIDVDARNGGVASFDKLMTQHPSLLAECGLVVLTGSGGGSMHLYYRMPDDCGDFVSRLEDFPGIDFKSSGFVVGPGSIHASGNRYEIIQGSSPSDIGPPPAELLQTLKRPTVHRVNTGSHIRDVSDDDIREMLYNVDPNCSYEDWRDIGFAINHATGGAGYDLWDAWSATASPSVYPGPAKTLYLWSNFNPKRDSPITIATLIKMSGWSPPVTFGDGAHNNSKQFDPSEGVDLLNPPGFVGEVCRWINGRSIYPRPLLAVAAALTVVSCASGMRHHDESKRLKSNVFMFCVAKSGTGKQSILDSTNALLSSAGLQAATYGNFKSEQEIFRNLLNHQAAFYIIDELGEVLGRITSARSSNGATYLTGIIGQLMSIFSKSHSTVNVTGDTKRELSKQLIAQYRALVKHLGDEPDEIGQRKIDKAFKNIQAIDDGLVHPFLNIMGLTTPETFDAVMTRDLLMNGFVSRTMIFRELEDNPRKKPESKILKGGVPTHIAMKLLSLYSPDMNEEHDEICQHGEIQIVKTTDEAKALLDDCYAYFWEIAEEHKNTTGLTPIPRRGHELVLKVSLLLGIPGGVVTAEHVRWAWALVDVDIKGKIALSVENDEDADEADALLSKIMSLVTREHGELQGKIRNACRKWDKAIVDRALDYLVENSKLRTEAAQRGAIRYFAK